MRRRSPPVRWLIDEVNWRMVSRFAPNLRGELLDIGCGDRPYEPLLAARVSRYVGLEHPGTIHPRGRVDAWGDARDLPFEPQSFDTVVSFHVLEHTEEPHEVVQEMFRVLRPGGAVFLTTPFMWGIHEAPRDFFRFTAHGLEHLLGQAGFETIEIRPFGGYWLTACLRATYYLERFARGPLAWVVGPLQLLVQATGATLDRIDRVPEDTPGYAVLGRKPPA